MKLIRANVNDCEKIWKMQTEAFSDLLERYQDYETSPGNEAKERIEAKLSQEFTYFYYIFDGDNLVGAIRVVDKKDGSRKRVAPVFIMKEFRNKGLAQKAFEEVEKFMDMIIGNLTPFFKKKEIVIYMRSWDIKGQDWLKI